MPAPVIKAQRVGYDACYLVVPQQLTRYNVATLFGLQQSTAVLRDLDGNDTSVSADARNLIPPMAPNGGGGGNGGDAYLWSLAALAEKAALLHADPGAAFVVHAMGTDAPLPASAQQNAAQKKVLLKQRGDARVRLVKKLAAEKVELDKAWNDAPWTVDSAMPVPQDSHLLGTAASPPPPPPAAAAPVAASALPAATPTTTTAASASTSAPRSQPNVTPAGGTVMEDGVAKRRCPRCQDLVVEQNFTLHSLRCRGPAQQQQQQLSSAAPPPAAPAAVAPTAPLAQPQRTVPSSSAQPQQQPQPARDQPGAPPPRAAVPSVSGTAPPARGLSSSSSSSALPPALTSEICPQCKTTVPPALWSAHPTICPKRACHCTYCGDTVPYGEYPDHVAQCKAEKTEQCPICGQTVGRNAMRAHREVCGASHQTPHQGRTHVPAAEPASAATAGTRTASWPSSSSSAAPAQRSTAALGAAAYTPSASPTSPPGGLGAVQGTSVLPAPPVQEDPDRLARCGDCGTMIPHSSKVGHSVVCAGAPMQCQWCSETLPRSLMEAHERRCGGQTSACPICSARVARQDLKRHPCYAILHPEDEEAQRYALESQREVESRSQHQQPPRSQPRGSPSSVPTHSSQPQPAAVPATSALMDDDEDDIVARAPIGTVASAMTDALLGPAAQERSRLAQEEARRLHGPSATGRTGVAGNGARGAGGVSSYLPHNRRAGGAAHGRLNTGVASRTGVGAGAGGAGTAGTTPSIPSYAAGTASSTTHRRGAGTGPSGTVARGRPSYGASPTNPPATGGTSSARGAQGTIQGDLASVGLGGVTAAARRATSNVGSSVASGVRGVTGSSGTGPSRAAGGSSTIGAGAGTTRRSTSSTATRGRGSTSTMGPAPARTTTTTTPAGPAGTRAGAHGAGAAGRGSYGSAELAQLGVAGRGTRQPSGPSASAHRYDVRPAHSGATDPAHASHGYDDGHSHSAPPGEDDEAVARRLQEQQDEEYARLMAGGDPTFGGEYNAYGGAPSSSHQNSGLGAGEYRGSGSGGSGGYGGDYGGVPSHPQPQRLAGSVPRQDDDEDAALAAQLARDDEARLQNDDVGYAQVLQHQGRQEAEDSDWALAQRLHAEEQSRGRRDFLSDDFRGGPGQRGGPGGPGGVPGIDPPARRHQPPRDPSGFGGGGAPDRATQEELDAAFARQLAQDEGGY